MCLLVLAWRSHPEFPLILVGNRDEFHDRPTAAADWWPDPDGVLGGRDLQAGGSWLAMNRSGRLAVVTNCREPATDVSGLRSRGELVIDSLSQKGPVREWISDFDARRGAYGGFNHLLFDGDGMHCLTNRGEDRLDLEPGIYGLSNRQLNTPWPKVVAARAGLRRLVESDRIDPESLFGLLSDRSPAPDAELPRTGVPMEWERALSAVFIDGPEYGTRASTAVRVNATGGVEFEERRFGPDAEPAGASRFSF